MITHINTSHNTIRPHSPSYTAAQSCAIDLSGVPQIPAEIAEKLSHVERYKAVYLTKNDYKRIRKAIIAACAEIRRRRAELMGAVVGGEQAVEAGADY